MEGSRCGIWGEGCCWDVCLVFNVFRGDLKDRKISWVYIVIDLMSNNFRFFMFSEFWMGMGGGGKILEG